MASGSGECGIAEEKACEMEDEERPRTLSDATASPGASPGQRASSRRARRSTTICTREPPC